MNRNSIRKDVNRLFLVCVVSILALLSATAGAEDKAGPKVRGLSDSDWITWKAQQGPNQVIAVDLDMDGSLIWSQ